MHLLKKLISTNWNLSQKLGICEKLIRRSCAPNTKTKLIYFSQLRRKVDRLITINNLKQTGTVLRTSGKESNP